MPALRNIVACHNGATSVVSNSCNPQAFTVEPKKTATFTLEFAPRTAGAHTHELALRVKSNPFEQHRIALAGECTQVRTLWQQPPLRHTICKPGRRGGVRGRMLQARRTRAAFDASTWFHDAVITGGHPSRGLAWRRPRRAAAW